MWNSALGRRAFLKKTGAASVGTALALHGFKTEVMASDSIKLRKKKTYKQSAEGKGFNTSFNTAKIEARGDAVTKVGSAAEDLESEEWVEAAPDDYWIPEIGWNEAYNPEDDTGLVAPYSVTCTLSKEHIVIA